MEIPAFSIFSAVSELLVTVIVLYCVMGNLGGRPFRWKLLGVGLLFEVCVNVMYMIHRAGNIDEGAVIPVGMKVLFALHGVLSLVMLVGLILLYLVATFDQKAGEPTWFQRHRAGTWSFVALWIMSVGSGEFAFVWRYLV